MNRLICCVALLVPLCSSADVVVPIDSVENHVNIRLSADATSDVVGRLNRGDHLQLVDTVDGWHEVEISGGATGFISVDWTNVLDDAPDTETAAQVAIDPAAEDAADEALEASLDTVTEMLPDEQAAAEAPVVEEFAQEATDPGELDSPQVQIDAEQSVVEREPPVEELNVDAVEAEVQLNEEVADVTAPMESLLPSADAEVAEVAPKVSLDPLAPAEIQLQDGIPAARGPVGPRGEPGPAGPPGKVNLEGEVGFLARFRSPTEGGNSQIYDDGNNVGIGTTEPAQRLEVNGNIQIREQNSSVAGLMITQSDGETGYIMHNRASTLTIGAGSIDRITIDRDGNVGVGVARPSHPLEMASGAHVSAGGVWTNSSSRARKENIAPLSADEALQALTALEAVQFNYKNDQAESYVGFIAEDVPALVATNGRDSLSSMDIVAVLTRVVQEQQRRIAELEARIDQR